MQFLMAFALAFLVAPTFSYAELSVAKPHVVRDTTPNPWEQWEYIEVVKENEDFNRPFGRKQNTEVIRRRKQPQLSDYTRTNSNTGSGDAGFSGSSGATKEMGIPKIIPIEPVASADQLPPVPEVRKDFSGYKIELMTATEALPPDHELFFRHGAVQVEPRPTGSFAYVLGAYETEEDAQKFYDAFLANRYEEGRVVKFEEGKRVE
jgi:hypothetical protein